MYHVKETIIVEGVYDKIRLSGFIDAVIYTTGGYAVFNNKSSQQTIRTLAEKTGIVILSDSDSAGIKIRNFVKQLAPDARILHAYIPEVKGKERRKDKRSAEGLLGVEGLSEDIIIKAIIASGATVDGNAAPKKYCITKADMFALGLSGSPKSSQMRSELAKKLGLPSKLSANMLLDVINRLLSRDELCSLCDEIKNSVK